MVVHVLADGAGERGELLFASSLPADSQAYPESAQLSLEPPLPRLGEPSVEPSTSTSINSLPNELLSNIFGFLDAPQPSASALLDEPIFELTHAEVANLKTLSLISKRWRHIVLPMLFKHARFIASASETKPWPMLGEEIQPFLDFVVKNSLDKTIISFVLLARNKKITYLSDGPEQWNEFTSFWRSLFGIIDPTELLIVAPAETLGVLTSCHVYTQDNWNFDCPYHYLKLQQPSSKKKQLPGEKLEPLPSNLAGVNIGDLSKHSVEPVHNSPESLLRRPLDTSSSSSQSVPQQEPPSSRAPLEEWEFPRAESSALFDIRPWSTLLLNEGSFIKGYSTYEFWLRQPPSILSELVGADEDSHQKPYISPTIRDMSYIGIFPMASHFNGLTTHLPRLDRLYVQLVPRNEILEDPVKMEQVDMEDLWMERNSCYALLMRELFNSPPLLNFRYLQVFESGDAADTDAWHMAVEYVKRAGMGWKIAGDGVFVRDSKDLEPEPAEGEDEDGSSFQGALVKWAWNGTTKLPVSAYPLYDRPMGPLT